MNVSSESGGVSWSAVRSMTESNQQVRVVRSDTVGASAPQVIVADDGSVTLVLDQSSASQLFEAMDESRVGDSYYVGSEALMNLVEAEKAKPAGQSLFLGIGDGLQRGFNTLKELRPAAFAKCLSDLRDRSLEGDVSIWAMLEEAAREAVAINAQTINVGTYASATARQTRFHLQLENAENQLDMIDAYESSAAMNMAASGANAAFGGGAAALGVSSNRRSAQLGKTIQAGKLAKDSGGLVNPGMAQADQVARIRAGEMAKPQKSYYDGISQLITPASNAFNAMTGVLSEQGNLLKNTEQAKTDAEQTILNAQIGLAESATGQGDSLSSKEAAPLVNTIYSTRSDAAKNIGGMGTLS